MDMREGDECGELLQEFQRREPNPRGAIGPWMGERVDEIAVGVLDQAFERYRTAGGRADELFQQVPPVRWDRGVRVQGKAVHAGTARTGEPWRLTLVAKACAEAPHGLASSLSTGDALLHGGRHGARERRLVVPERLIPGG